MKTITVPLTDAALDVCPMIDDYAGEWSRREGFRIVLFAKGGAEITCTRERAKDLLDHFEYIADRKDTNTTIGEARAASAAAARIRNALEAA